MKQILLIFLFISLCVAEDILDIYKRDLPDEWPKPHKRMSNTIKYYADSESITPVEYVLRDMNDTLCITFIRQNNKIIDSGINFYKSNSKSYKSNSKSDIILRDSKSKPTDIYLKESDLKYNKNSLLLLYIGLALGLIPEIARYDRDNYVTVNSNNIDSKYISYYKKTKSKTTYSTSFDYGSAMLLNSSFGSKNNKATYTYKLSPHYDSTIGNNILFSHNDNKRINILYCSKKKCDKYRKCQHGSFPQKQCKRCICQQYFHGKLCEKLFSNDKKMCGNQQELKSYSSSRKSLKKTNIRDICLYKLKSTSNKKKVEVTVKSLVYDGNVPCDGRSGLFIYYRSDKSVSPLYLCKNSSNIVLPASSTTVYIAINSPFDVKSSFEISYKSR
uniref:Metalloendopeptidase n=1 Tax=Strongyloides papillosus TaxID=174720 RepID=A0A0N5BZ77_STREA